MAYDVFILKSCSCISTGPTTPPSQHQYWTRSKSHGPKPSPAHVTTSSKEIDISAEDEKPARQTPKKQKVQHLEKSAGPSLKRKNLSAAEIGELWCHEY